MSSLRDLQLRFAAALAGDAAAVAAFCAESSAGEGADARFAIYRSNGRANYRNALAATYPVVRRLTGAPFFDAAVDGFVDAHPPAALRGVVRVRRLTASVSLPVPS